MIKNEENKQNEQVVARYSQYAAQVLQQKGPLSFNADGSAPQVKIDGERLADRLYSSEELAQLPEAAADASIGCGNPLVVADLQAGDHVLDLGSGGGIDCFLTAKVVGPAGYVIGVDATPTMISLANKNKEKMGLTNVEFRLGNIEELPVASGMIDAIISNCVIDISADKAAVFAEAFRVLKPGGRVAISDTVLCGDFPAKLKANIDIWAGALITPLIDIEEYLHFMAAAGFVAIEVESLTSYGLENFVELDEASQTLLTTGLEWSPLPAGTGLYSALIRARKPVG